MRNGGATPVVVLEGMEDVIERDLDKHKVELERTKTELEAFREAKRHECRKRKSYEQHLKAGRFDTPSMERALVDIDVNVKHMEGRISACEAHIKFEENIVATLTGQLTEQNKSLALLADYRRENGTGH